MFQWCYLLNASYRVGSRASKAAYFTHYVCYFAKPTTGWPSEFWVPYLPKISGVRLQSGMVPYLYRPVHTAVSTEYRCNSCSILWTRGGCALYAPSTVQRILVDAQISSNCRLIFEQVVTALVLSLIHISEPTRPY